LDVPAKKGWAFGLTNAALGRGGKREKRRVPLVFVRPKEGGTGGTVDLCGLPSREARGKKKREKEKKGKRRENVVFASTKGKKGAEVSQTKGCIRGRGGKKEEKKRGPRHLDFLSWRKKKGTVSGLKTKKGGGGGRGSRLKLSFSSLQDEGGGGRLRTLM